MKKLLSFIFAFIFVALVPIQTLAVDSVNHQFDVLLMNDISDLSNCVIAERSGLNEIKRIDTSTMDKLRELNATDEEKSKEVFENIGISYSADNKSQETITENFNKIKSASSSVSYMKISEDGTQTIMSKEDCLNEIEQADNRIRSSVIGDSNEKMTMVICVW